MRNNNNLFRLHFLNSILCFRIRNEMSKKKITASEQQPIYSTTIKLLFSLLSLRFWFQLLKRDNKQWATWAKLHLNEIRFDMITNRLKFEKDNHQHSRLNIGIFIEEESPWTGKKSNMFDVFRSSIQSVQVSFIILHILRSPICCIYNIICAYEGSCVRQFTDNYFSLQIIQIHPEYTTKFHCFFRLCTATHYHTIARFEEPKYSQSQRFKVLFVDHVILILSSRPNRKCECVLTVLTCPISCTMYIYRLRPTGKFTIFET